MQFKVSNLSHSTTYKSLLPFLRISCFIALLLLGSYQSDTKSDSQLLNRTLPYHDPEDNGWQLRTCLYLSHTDTESQAQNFVLELDKAIGNLILISRQYGKELYLLDGKLEINQEDRKKYKLAPEALKRAHSFYPYLYWLPMKLIVDGVNMTEAGNVEEFERETYQLLQVNDDAAVGNDNCFFYLDTETYAMEAYCFNLGKAESGEYFLLEQEVAVGGI